MIKIEQLAKNELKKKELKKVKGGTGAFIIIEDIINA